MTSWGRIGNPEDHEDCAQEIERLSSILDEVRLILRSECGEYDGANDWPDDLHPADVIEKHLGRAARAEIRELRRAIARIFSPALRGHWRIQTNDAAEAFHALQQLAALDRAEGRAGR